MCTRNLNSPATCMWFRFQFQFIRNGQPEGLSKLPNASTSAEAADPLRKTRSKILFAAWTTFSRSAPHFYAAIAFCRGAGNEMMKHSDTNGAPTSATFDFARPSPAAHDSEITEAPRFDEADFDALFESSGEALVMIDAEGIVRNANGRGRELLGLKEPVPRHT